MKYEVFRRRLYDLIDKGMAAGVIDLRKVDRIDSTGIGMLIVGLKIF